MHKNYDSSNLHMPKRSYKVLSLSDKVKLDLMCICIGEYGKLRVQYYLHTHWMVLKYISCG